MDVSSPPGHVRVHGSSESGKPDHQETRADICFDKKALVNVWVFSQQPVRCLVLIYETRQALQERNIS